MPSVTKLAIIAARNIKASFPPGLKAQARRKSQGR